MLLQFVTMQPIDMEKAQDTHQDWEMDLRVLAKNYLLSWFIIDFCSIGVPYCRHPDVPQSLTPAPL